MVFRDAGKCWCVAFSSVTGTLTSARLADKVSDGGSAAFKAAAICVDERAVTTATVRADRQRMGRAAALSGPALALVIPLTMPIVGFSEHETLVWTALIVPIAVVSGVVGWFLPWRKWPDSALLAVPMTGFASLDVLGLASDGRASVYGGYTSLLFLFIGLTQRAWTSLAMLPLAIMTQVLLYGGFDAQLVARLPISVIVWLVSAEIISRYRARTSDVVDDLETQAHRDPLTGLGNRYGLGRRQAALRPGDAALLIDLDDFKHINDVAGHAAGDQALRDFGTVVLSVLRASDHAVRYGGEEFLILVPGAGELGAQRLDGRLRAAWAQARPDITYSGGIAVVGIGIGDSERPVLARADQALYRAKALGRNRTLAHSNACPAIDKDSPVSLANTAETAAVQAS
jgi:diguanylate cyclase (GGDEF)-like protein